MQMCGAIVRAHYIDQQDNMEQTVPWLLGKQHASHREKHVKTKKIGCNWSSSSVSEKNG